MRRIRPARAGPIRRTLVTAVAVIAAGFAGSTAGCRADPALGTTPAATASAAAPSAAPGMPAEADAAAVRATVDAFNDTATPADQRQRLADLVEPDRRNEVERCAAASTTVRFEPVYAGLRALAGESGPSSTTYALPTLARVYSSDRLVGTDLTTLQLVVNAATGVTEAYLTPFCVN